MLNYAAPVALVCTLLLSACGATGRVNDAAPLPADVPADSSPTQPAETPTATLPAVPTIDTTAVVAFKIDGGIVGFCDELTIDAQGDYVLTTCDQGETNGSLSQTERLTLKSWYENLTGFDLFTDEGKSGADNLTTTLTFTGRGQTEADDAQKQMVFDWINGLILQLRPKPEIVMDPTPTVENPNGLCPEIQRPALILIDFEKPTAVQLMDITTQATCDITLAHPPFGRVMPAGGNLYYPVANQEAKSVTLWRFAADGTQIPLEFTRITMDEPSPYGYVVSDDGAKVAWAQTFINLETDPPVYTNYMWRANIDGTGQETLLDAVDNSELRFASPVRFSSVDNSLYYALQPNLGGSVLGGRLDNLYHVPAGVTEAEIVYTCPVEENPICITGVAVDGSVYTVLDPTTDAVQIIKADGTLLNSIPLPATDYVERASFSPSGKLAFLAAKFTEPENEGEIPLPNPGYIMVMEPPYTGDARTLLADNSVGTLWGWLNDTSLAFGALGTANGARTALVNLDGQVQEISPLFAVGVLP
jgi:hypothetical protein